MSEEAPRLRLIKARNGAHDLAAHQGGQHGKLTVVRDRIEGDLLGPTFFSFVQLCRSYPHSSNPRVILGGNSAPVAIGSRQPSR